MEGWLNFVRKVQILSSKVSWIYSHVYNFLYFLYLFIGNYEVWCAVLKYLPNLEIVTTPTQPQHKLNLT